MLGRTANAIFWMYRYLERAENTARLLDAVFRMALTRGVDAAREEWSSVLSTLGLHHRYAEAYGEITGQQVFNFVLRDSGNPDNVLQMLERARSNARMSRSSLTLEVWEGVNEAWMSLRDLLSRPVRESNLGPVLANIRRESTAVRGATYGTMLRNEIYHFARAGTFIERAENTARILDVKYHLLLPSLAHVGSSLDSSQWDHVLRSLAGDRVYSWLNAGRIDPRGIAEFLILDKRFPRSLTFSYGQLRENLAALAQEHGAEMPTQALLRDADMKLKTLTIAEIFEIGLHQFLVDFIAQNQKLSIAISEDYRFVA